MAKVRYVPYMTIGGRIALMRAGTGARIKNHPVAIKMRNCLKAAKGKSLTERKNALRNCM